MKNPCDRCHAARFCTRRCYAWKDYNRSRKEKENSNPHGTRVWRDTPKIQTNGGTQQDG